MDNERSLDEVALDIQKLSQMVKKHQDSATQASTAGDDEGLSIAIGSLARVNSGLGRLAAYAKYISRNANRVVERLKEERDAERSRLVLQYSQTQAVNKSEHQAKVEATEEYTPRIDAAFSAYSTARLLADEADDLTYRTDTFLKMSQSRLSILKADKGRS